MKIGDIAFYVTLGGLFALGTAYTLTQPNGLSLTEAGAVNLKTVGILLAAGLTLALYSFLYKDNPFFKAAEHVYVGVGLGYQIVTVWFQVLKPDLYQGLVRYWVRRGWLGEEVARPNYLLLVPLILGLMLLARFVPKISWLSRWSFAFIVGFASGVAIPNTIKAILLTQVRDTLKPLTPDAGFVALASAIVIRVGVVTVLIYFFFSVEHRGAFGAVSRIGVWFLMISFGASFGYTVMGRMALLTKRISFLLQDWLRLPF
jgi:hypothetical protein